MDYPFSDGLGVNVRELPKTECNEGGSPEEPGEETGLPMLRMEYMVDEELWDQFRNTEQDKQ